MTAYKFLAQGAVGRFSDFQWPPPGEWVTTQQPLVDCLQGIHAVRMEQLLDWIDDELWEIELGGAVADREDILVAERGRLVRRIESWDEGAAQSFADDCASRSGAIAAKALRDAGLADEARRLEHATDLVEVQEAAVAALAAVGASEVTDIVAFAADMVSLVGGNRPDTWIHTGATVRTAQSSGAIAANAAFVAAHVAGRAAVTRTSSESAYGKGFHEERAWQLARLNELIDDS